MTDKEIKYVPNFDDCEPPATRELCIITKDKIKYLGYYIPEDNTIEKASEIIKDEYDNVPIYRCPYCEKVLKQNLKESFRVRLHQDIKGTLLTISLSDNDYITVHSLSPRDFSFYFHKFGCNCHTCLFMRSEYKKYFKEIKEKQNKELLKGE